MRGTPDRVLAMNVIDTHLLSRDIIIIIYFSQPRAHDVLDRRDASKCHISHLLLDDKSPRFISVWLTGRPLTSNFPRQTSS